MQIGVNLFKKDGRRAQISGVGHKLLYEIYPWSGNAQQALWMQCALDKGERGMQQHRMPSAMTCTSDTQETPGEEKEGSQDRKRSR